MVLHTPTLVVQVLILSVLALEINASKAIQESTRLVVTFKKTGDNNVLQSDPRLQGMRIVKRYGRRLVLDLRRPFDLDVERLFFMQNFKSVERVDRDLMVGLQQLEMGKVVIEEALYVSPLEMGLNASNPDVEAAYIDPASQTPLWNLMDSEPYSVHVEEVWKLTNSTLEVVVAVIDTGIAYAARDVFLNLLDGYDFISDSEISLDDDERDPDPTDPGDFGELCPTSSWHGTKVASILAARHDNEWGMKGVAQNCSVLPIRVLGLCRMGYASDVTDAIVWAAGGAIDEVPDNPNPAKVISLSLTGQGACPDYLQSAITQATALGAVVVAAAGNNNQNVSRFFPANCKGVISVAASTREGKLAEYSNWGDLIAVSAPGGDSANAIMTLSVNEMETGIDVSYGIGTSFAAPHVAGIISLIRQNSNSSLTTFFDRYILYMKNLSNETNLTCNSQRCVRGVIDGYRVVVGTGYCSAGTGLTATRFCGLEGVLYECDSTCYNCPAGFKYVTWKDQYEYWEGCEKDCSWTTTYTSGQERFCVASCGCACPPGSFYRKRDIGSSQYFESCNTCTGNNFCPGGTGGQTPCPANTFSNPGSSVCKPALTSCAAGKRTNPTYNTPWGYQATCPAGQYVCGFNHQSCTASFFYCCSLGGAQVGYWKISTSSFSGAITNGVFYTSTSTEYPTSPWSAYGTANTYPGITYVNSNFYGINIKTDVTILLGSQQTNENYIVQCPDGQVVTGFGGYLGACIGAISAVCNSPCTDCLAGTYSNAGAATCTACTSLTCPGSQYRINCGGANSGSCTPCAECGSGKYWSLACSGTNAGVCSPCTANNFCTGGTNAPAAWTLTCPIGGYLDPTPTPSADGVCRDCTGATFRRTPTEFAWAPERWTSKTAWTHSTNPSRTPTNCVYHGKFNSQPAYVCDGPYYVWPDQGAMWLGSPFSNHVGTNIYQQLGPTSPVVLTGFAVMNILLPTINILEHCTSCISNCLVGTYQTGCGGTSAGQCSECISGHYCPGGSSSPIAHTIKDCTAGNFLSTPPSPSTNGACQQCPAGKFKEGTNALTACSDCAPGTASVPGSSICATCILGNSWSAGGAATCTPCQDVICSIFQYKIACSLTANVDCGTCPPPPSNAALVDATNPACTWICNSGFYRSSSTCVACTATSTACNTGQYRAPCADGGTEDGKCLACTNGPVNSVYTGVSTTTLSYNFGVPTESLSNCPYNCNAGFIRDATYGFCCVPCSNGHYNPSCSKTSSGACIPCNN